MATKRANARCDERATDIRAVGVVVERIDSNVRALAEAMTSMRDELKADIRNLDVRLSERISVLEDVVRQNSVDIRKNSDAIGQLRAEVAQLRIDFNQLRADFDNREERARVIDLEARVSLLEQRARIRR